MSYKSELKGRRLIAAGKIQAYTDILEDGDALSESERRAFDAAAAEVRECDTQLANLKSPDYSGLDKARHEKRAKRTTNDRVFSEYLRGNTSRPEFRGTLDSGNGMSTAPNSAGTAAGATGYDAGYLIPQGFWNQLAVALKAYGGLSAGFQTVVTPTGNPMPWPSVNPTAVVGSYITEQSQLGFGGDSAGTDYQFGQGMLNAWTIVSGVILASVVGWPGGISPPGSHRIPA